jgi:hypothetical protein
VDRSAGAENGRHNAAVGHWLVYAQGVALDAAGRDARRIGAVPVCVAQLSGECRGIDRRLLGGAEMGGPRGNAVQQDRQPGGVEGAVPRLSHRTTVSAYSIWRAMTSASARWSFSAAWMASVRRSSVLARPSSRCSASTTVA